VAKRFRKILEMTTSHSFRTATETAGIYVHFPFCKTRCSYCDFVTEIYVKNHRVEEYVRALCLEIENFSPHEKIKVDTIYFGGGTPSLLEPKQVEQILNAIDKNFSVDADIEFTLEMNPATVTYEKLHAFRDLGVNRASFGIQTFDNNLLKVLARHHTAEDALKTFELLRKAGFENISFDLIAGLPYQTLKGWENDVEQAIKLYPEHLSLYLLEIHENTPLAEQIRSSRRPMPDDDLAAAMYEMMIDKLQSAGYLHYEISNFALRGFESKHNIKYWLCQSVFGFGVSAVSFHQGERWGNERNTVRYIELVRLGKSPCAFKEKPNLASETVFLGLRLAQGVNLEDYKKRFGFDLRERFADEFERLREFGLVEVKDDSLRLTRKGFLYSNEVFAVFV
jgi:oxygen-independent coproporphyrinogen-3 oxidase